MGLKQLMQSHVSSVFLNTDEHAESVTRYPGGDTEAGAPVTAIFDERPQQRDRQAGDKTIRVADLQINQTVTVTIEDTWLCAGEVWQTETLGEVGFGGMRHVVLMRHDKRQTTATRGGRFT